MLDIEKDYRFLLENIEGFLVIDKDEKLLYCSLKKPCSLSKVWFKGFAVYTTQC